MPFLYLLLLLFRYSSLGPRTRRFEEAFRHELYNLEVAALQYDAETVSNQIKIAMKVAKRWTNVWVEAEMRKATERRNMLLENVGETGETLGQDITAKFCNGIAPMTQSTYHDGRNDE